jgi:hypothetical protein
MRTAVLFTFSVLVCSLGCGNDPSGPQPTEPTPSDLTITLVDSTGCEIEAVWTICTDVDFASYALYRSIVPGISADPGSAEVLGSFLDPNQHTFVDTTTAWATTYYYAVSTSDDEGLVAWSDEDSASTPGIPTVPDVTGLAIDPSSSGVSVVLAWDAISGAEGYKVWFSAEASGAYVEVGNVAVTTFTHLASCAGTYAVTAYIGDDQSADYSNVVSTMPNIITTEYDIYDNNAPADYFMGFIFGATSGEAGFASSPSFDQDIYAYDIWGDPNRLAFYSGTYGPFGEGNSTWMYGLGDSGYSNPGAAPDEGAGWWNNGEIYLTDVIFCELSNDYFVKVYILDIYGPVGGTTNGTGVTFIYEFQPIQGLRLFTTNT